jgi:hypothetical protein
MKTMVQTERLLYRFTSCLQPPKRQEGSLELDMLPGKWGKMSSAALSIPNSLIYALSNPATTLSKIAQEI